MRVHQFHPTLAPGDAMSNHVFALRKKIRHWGYDSFAYAVEAKPGVADVRSYRRLFRDVKEIGRASCRERVCSVV